MTSQPNVLFLLSDEHNHRCFCHLDAVVEADPLEQRNIAGDPDHGAARDRLSALVTGSMDFDAAETEYRRDDELYGEYKLDIPRGTGNAYILPDRRVVDAQTPLYKPDVLANDPSAAYDDWPG